MRTRLPLAFALLLTACNRAALKPVDSALLARQACFKELNAPEIRDSGGFLALGKRKEEEAAELPAGDEKRRAQRCALAAYEAAGAVNNSDPIPLKEAGDFYFRQGDFPRASEQYEQALVFDPHCVGANLGLARIARRGRDFSAAARFLEEEVRANPRGDEAFAESGNMAMSEGVFAKAEKSFSRAYALNPQNLDALYGRAVAKRLQSKLSAALADFRRLASLAPDSRPNVYWQLGGVLEQLKKKKEALAAYRHFLELVDLEHDPLADRARVEEKIRALIGADREN